MNYPGRSFAPREGRRTFWMEKDRERNSREDKRCCCVCEEEHGWTEMFQDDCGWFRHPSLSHDDSVSSWDLAEIMSEHDINAVMPQGVCHLLGRCAIIVGSFEPALCRW